MKGFGDDFGFDFGGTVEVEGIAPGSLSVVVYVSTDGLAFGDAPGSLTVISYSSIDGEASVVRRRRRRMWPIEEFRQDAEAPGSTATITYVSISGKAVGNGSAAGSIRTVVVEQISGKAAGQKVFVVSGKAIGDAKAPGAISEISVSAVSGSIASRLDNDFLMSDAEPTVHPVDVDNDLLLAA